VAKDEVDWDWGAAGCCVRASQRTYVLLIPRSGLVQSNLLEARVVIASYNDHCSAPFSRAFLAGWHHQSLLGSTEPTLSWNQCHSLAGS